MNTKTIILKQVSEARLKISSKYVRIGKLKYKDGPYLNEYP